MTRGINCQPGQFPYRLTPERVNLKYAFHLVPEELNPKGPLFLVGGENFHHITPHPKGSSMEIHITPLIMDFHQLPQHLLPLNFLSSIKVEQ